MCRTLDKISFLSYNQNIRFGYWIEPVQTDHGFYDGSYQRKF